MRNRIIISFFVGLILGLLFLIPVNRFQKEKVIYKVDTVRTVDTVTHYIQKEPITYTQTIYKPQIMYVDSSVFNNYTDTLNIEPNFYFWYNARVKGTIESMALNYFDNRPIKISTIFDTQTITETKTIQPRGFYGGLLVGINEVSPSIIYLRKKSLYLAGFNVVEGQIKIGYARKF